MKILSLLLVILIAGCAAETQTKSSPRKNVIVMDGTENKQFEDLMFCGDVKAFVAASGDVGSKLNAIWKALPDQKSGEKCTIRIKVKRSGNIIGHSIESCADRALIPEFLKKASPVPVPKDECLFQSINDMSYELGTVKKDDAP